MDFDCSTRIHQTVSDYDMIEQHRGYGYEMLEAMKQEFKPYGYVPPQSESHKIELLSFVFGSNN